MVGTWVGAPCVFMYVCVWVYIHIHIYIERERDLIYIYICIYIICYSSMHLFINSDILTGTTKLARPSAINKPALLS